MAESVFALAALRAVEAGESERVIGRDELPALLRRLEWALVEVCLQLGPAVRSLNAREGRVELEASGELVFRAMESAVLSRVVAELGLGAEAEAETFMKLLKAAVGCGVSTGLTAQRW